MALSWGRRKKLKDEQFALPGRRFPIQSKHQAHLALNPRFFNRASPSEQLQIRAAVARKYGNIGSSFTQGRRSAQWQ